METIDTWSTCDGRDTNCSIEWSKWLYWMEWLVAIACSQEFVAEPIEAGNKTPQAVASSPMQSALTIASSASRLRGDRLRAQMRVSDSDMAAK
jgi:hypothetical protein